MDSELILDVRSLFAEELAMLLKACGDLIEKSPDDPRLADLKIAAEKFARVAEVTQGEKKSPPLDTALNDTP